MKRLRFLALLLILLCAFATFASADGRPPITPEDLKMTSEPLAPGAPAIILYRQVDRDDSGIASYEDNLIRIKILTEEGRKYADVEIPYPKSAGFQISRLTARTIHPDGSTYEFTGKPFEKQIAKARGFKYMAKTFTLPDVEVGSIIEYSYRQEFYRFFYSPRWILNQELFTKRAVFSLKPSDMWSLRWTGYRLPLGTTPPKSTDRVLRTEVSNIAAFKIEDYMPPENEVKSLVEFTYSADSEHDATKFWKKRAKQWDEYVENFVNRRKAMEQVVSQVVSPEDRAEVKARKLFDRVQKLRNISYERDKTAQEYKREKQKDNLTVEDVWKHGYGEIDDLNWLFLALVRAAGLEAYPVLVSDRYDYFFQPSQLDEHKLGFPVVLVKIDGKDVYCDPGAPFVPFGMLMWYETGVPGLRLGKDGGQWVTTPLPNSAASKIVHSANVIFSETGNLSGKLAVTYTGLAAADLRTDERNEDETHRKKKLEDEVKDLIPVASEVDLTNKPDWTSSSDPLTAEFQLKVDSWGSAAGRKFLLPVGLFSAGEKGMFEHAERVHPIYFEYPNERDDDIAIVLPPGWQVTSIPKESIQDGRVIFHSLKAESNNSSVRITLKFSNDILLLDVKSYAALRAFFQAVRTSNDEQILLDSGATKAHN